MPTAELCRMVWEEPVICLYWPLVERSSFWFHSA
jgi:hypothetical protein